MKVLAIGAHPDDIEIFMFGLISTLKERGDDIYLMVATDGGLGGDGNKEELVKLRYLETSKALKKLGELHLLGLSDGCLGDNEKDKNILREKINKLSPELIITHANNDYHVDHRKLSELVTSIVSHYIPVIFCDTLMGVNFHPTYYIDITNHFKFKEEAILHHQSQKPQRFVKLARLMNSYRAAQCNAPNGCYAEAYTFNSSFPFTDIRILLPATIKLRPFHIKNINGFL